jgi:hypothetical protein
MFIVILTYSYLTMVLGYLSNYNATINRALACMNHNGGLGLSDNNLNSNLINVKEMLVYPNDAEAHYNHLLKITKAFRENIPPHRYAEYSGPWLENLWIEKFLLKPLSFFGGLIPIFVQWTDMHVSFMKKALLKNGRQQWDDTVDFLATHLRKDVLYVMVSQDDEGLARLQTLRPNILSLSAGGFGHIPLPLIKGSFQIPTTKLNSNVKNVDIGFYGNVKRRYKILAKFKKTFESVIDQRDNMTLVIHDRTILWRHHLLATTFNLVPRGFGRTSFRLAEILQAGRIPIYLYDDIAWLPYPRTAAHLVDGNIGFAASALSDIQLHDLIMSIKRMDSASIVSMTARCRSMAYYYTYQGVLEQLELFFQEPFVKGYIRCSEKIPKTWK